MARRSLMRDRSGARSDMAIGEPSTLVRPQTIDADVSWKDRRPSTSPGTRVREQLRCAARRCARVGGIAHAGALLAGGLSLAAPARAQSPAAPESLSVDA